MNGNAAHIQMRRGPSMAAADRIGAVSYMTGAEMKLSSIHGKHACLFCTAIARGLKHGINGYQTWNAHGEISS